jgi:hypothetical protein
MFVYFCILMHLGKKARESSISSDILAYITTVDRVLAHAYALFGRKYICRSETMNNNEEVMS